jgi:hypothetical protein
LTAELKTRVAWRHQRKYEEWKMIRTSESAIRRRCDRDMAEKILKDKRKEMA